MTPGHRPSLDEVAAAAIDAEDVRVLERMAHVYQALDPVPEGLVERIQFGMTLQALTAEIADLQRSGELVGVRAGESSDVETITFTSATLTTMVTITHLSTERVRIDGWVAPGGGVPVELRRVGNSATTTADADGRFVFENVPRGLAQFVLHPPAGTGRAAVVTPSVEL